MRRVFGGPSPLVAILLLLLPFCAAFQRMIQSDSLQPCTDQNGPAGFTADTFKVAFYPDKKVLTFAIAGTSTVSGNVTARVTLTAYGYPALTKDIDACDVGLPGLCPLPAGRIPLVNSTQNDIGGDTIDKIPSIAYTVPDLDGDVTVKIISKDTGKQVGCVQAHLTNGATVYQKSVAWVVAVVTILLFLASGLLYEMRGPSASADTLQFAGSLVTLLSYFQTQALFGMAGVPLPPIVASWTQNFQWTAGIIHLGFVQTIATWYVRSTGGTSSLLIPRANSISLAVTKRDEPMHLMKRDTVNQINNSTTVRIHGMQRVGYRAGVELTDIFGTSYAFFTIFMIVAIAIVCLSKVIIDQMTKSGKLQPHHFVNYRDRFLLVLKGGILRAALVAFTPLCSICLYEFYFQSSNGNISLAATTIVCFLATMIMTCIRVMTLAQRSLTMYQAPDRHPLYANPDLFEKWGPLYYFLQPHRHWFFIPSIIMPLLIGVIIAFLQDLPLPQAIGITVVNLLWLVGVSMMHPWTTKGLQIVNISVAAVNFVSSVFILFFTEQFGLSGLVSGIMGVLFFVMNAACALILLIAVLLNGYRAVFDKNKAIDYRAMTGSRDSTKMGLQSESEPIVAQTSEYQSNLTPGHPWTHDDKSTTSLNSEDHFNSPGYAARRSRLKTGIWQKGAGYEY